MKKRLDEVVKKIKAIDKKYYIIFISTIILGLLAHLYMFTNKIPNTDDIVVLNGYGGSFTMGRWFNGLLGIAKYRFVGSYSTPWLSGIMGLFCIALFTCIFVKMFEINSIILGICIGGIFATFPTVTGFYLFMFIAPYFLFGMLLAVSGIYLIIKKHCLWGMICCVCSTGIYQASLPVMATLLVMFLICECIREDRNLKEVFRKAIYYFCTLVVSFVVYRLVDKLFINVMHLEVSSHKGLNHIELFNLGEGIGQAYTSLFGILFKDYYGLSSNALFRVFLWLLFAIAIVLILVNIVRFIRKKQYGKCVLFIFLLSIMPIAVIVFAMIKTTEIYTLMVYSFALIFIFPLILAERETTDNVIECKVFYRAIQKFAILISIVIIFYYTSLANEVYLAQNISFENARLYMNRMITQVTSCEGYKVEMPVYVMGTNTDITITDLLVDRGTTDNFLNISNIGGYQDTKNFAGNGDFLREFWKIYCGYEPLWASEEDIAGYESEIQAMPAYPNFGSVQIINDIVVINLGEN